MKPTLPQDAKVFITHLRYFEHVTGYKELWTKGEAKKLNITSPPLGRGGITHVQIELADGRKLHGVAKCNMLDNFNKARGRMIATGRALKTLEQT